MRLIINTLMLYLKGKTAYVPGLSKLRGLKQGSFDLSPRGLYMTSAEVQSRTEEGPYTSHEFQKVLFIKINTFVLRFLPA